jgi:hypothetical protein
MDKKIDKKAKKADKEKQEQEQKQKQDSLQEETLTEEDLVAVSGGSLRDAPKQETESISEDTKRKI